VSANEHGKAADYTLAKLRLGRIGAVVDAALTLLLTIGGALRRWTPCGATPA